MVKEQKIILPDPSVLILIPFDIGRSYAFKAKEKGLDSSGTYIEQQWTKLLTDSGKWQGKTEQLSDYYKPLGWGATLPLQANEEASNDVIKASIDQTFAAIDETQWLKQGSANCTVIFFSLGIGVLLIEGSLKGSAHSFLDACAHKQGIVTQKKHFMEKLDPVVSKLTNYYTGCMDKIMASEQKGEKRIVEIQLSKRYKKVKECGVFYPVIFSARDEFDKLKALDERFRADKHRHGKDNLIGSKCEIVYETAFVYVGWVQGYVTEHKEESKKKIIDNFTIAITSWYALLVMDRDSTFKLHEAVYGLVVQDSRRIVKSDISSLRLLYLEAANASYPIRWTIREKDLLLLEAIHKAWGSKRWINNINERTQSLALYLDQLQAQSKEEFTHELSILGLIIAVFSITSVITDVLDLKEEIGEVNTFIVITLVGLILLYAVKTVTNWRKDI